MVFALNILLTFGLAAIAAWHLDVARLFNVLQPVVVCLSIMAAAVFVRLNRGMPALDWKNLEAKDRKDITGRIVDLTREYMQIVALNGFTLIGVMILTGIGQVDILVLDLDYKRAISGAFIFFVSLCVVRMAYVVWRDFDIVRLQKELLDKAADRDEAESKKIAEEKVAKMKAANLQASPMNRAVSRTDSAS